MQSHFYNYFKYGRRNIEALWASNPNGKLILFVHGFKFFGNNPTWKRFKLYLKKDREFDTCDIVFYGYDSRENVLNNETTFKDFLEELYSKNINFIRKFLKADDFTRNNNFQYNQIFIVAHSFGALVSRCGLNLLHKSNNECAEKCSFILFAPAHLGERCSDYYDDLAKELWIWPLVRGLKHSFISLDDLKPKSDPITKLQTKIESLIKEGVTSFTIAKKTIVPRRDEIVISNHYCSDIEPFERFYKSHTSIKKPKRNYMEPIKILKEVII